MRASLLSGLVVAGLVLLVVWLFDIKLERAAVLAPVLVVVAGAVAGLAVLWTKIGWGGLGRRGDPRGGGGGPRGRSRCLSRFRCSASSCRANGLGHGPGDRPPRGLERRQALDGGAGDRGCRRAGAAGDLYRRGRSLPPPPRRLAEAGWPSYV